MEGKSGLLQRNLPGLTHPVGWELRLERVSFRPQPYVNMLLSWELGRGQQTTAAMTTGYLLRRKPPSLTGTLIRKRAGSP